MYPCNKEFSTIIDYLITNRNKVSAKINTNNTISDPEMIDKYQNYRQCDSTNEKTNVLNDDKMFQQIIAFDDEKDISK